MQTGTKISGIAHVGLISAALFGGVFAADPLPFEVSEVSVISSEEYAALTAPREPTVDSEAPVAPSEPEPVESKPDDIAEPDPVPVPDPPEPAPEPVEPDVIVAPEPPAPQAADRVAPEPVEKPPEETKPDDVAQPDVAEDEGAETPQEPQEATAPEEATDQIVTEADEVSNLAPTQSVRPPASRPERPKPEAKPEAETSNAVNAALAEAMASETASPSTPTGPPMSGGEKDALRVAVSKCWNVGSLSSEALATTVVVSVSMSQDGKPVTNSIRMLSSSGGSDASARKAFDAARRAIIRCGSKGFDLPPEKYSHWQEIEMTFKPESMRIK